MRISRSGPARSWRRPARTTASRSCRVRTGRGSWRRGRSSAWWTGSGSGRATGRCWSGPGRRSRPPARRCRVPVRPLIGPIPADALVSVGGRERVTSAVVRAGGATRRLDVDLVVFGDRSPNLDLVLAAGAAVGRRGDVLVPTLDPSGRTSVASLFAVGSAADRPILDQAAADSARATGRHAAALRPVGRADRRGTGRGRRRPGQRHAEMAAHSHPSGRVARGAIVCFCEDVRAWEIRAELAAGYADPELVKRRTGALTGPCQGKYCLQSFACLVGDGPSIPTARPPLRPVRLGDLVATEPDDPGPADGTFGRRHAARRRSPATERRRRHRRRRDRRARVRARAGGARRARRRHRRARLPGRWRDRPQRRPDPGDAADRGADPRRARLPGEVRPDGRGARVQRPVLPARLRVGAVRGRRGRADARDRRDAPPDRGRQPAPVARRHAPAPADPARRRAGRGRRPQRRRDRPSRRGRLGASRAPGPDERPDRAGHDGPRDRPRGRTASRRSRPTAAGSARGPSSTPPTAGRASSTPWPASRRRTGRSGARSS